jgi:hypothetical protein
MSAIKYGDHWLTKMINADGIQEFGAYVREDFYLPIYSFKHDGLLFEVMYVATDTSPDDEDREDMLTYVGDIEISAYADDTDLFVTSLQIGFVENSEGLRPLYLQGNTMQTRKSLLVDNYAWEDAAAFIEFLHGDMRGAIWLANNREETT